MDSFVLEKVRSFGWRLKGMKQYHCLARGQELQFRMVHAAKMPIRAGQECHYVVLKSDLAVVAMTHQS